MNNILHKVQKYLSQVSDNPVAISDKLVEEFGESCKAAIRKQFSEKRRENFKPRISSIGRPLCQLQMESKGIKGEGQPYNVKIRNTFGDLIESLAIFVMKSAGVEVKDEQKKVSYKFEKSQIDGQLDVKIDDKVWDIKSASPYSFEKKFGEGGWIVINKSTGEWTVCETPVVDTEYKKKAIDTAVENFKALESKVPFKRCFDAVEETFRTKPTGNKVLGTACSFCPYKLPCWGSGLQLLPQQQSKGKNPKWVWYTEVNNPKQEEASA